MGSAAYNSDVEQATIDAGWVRATVVYPDSTTKQVQLVGNDCDRFARVKQLVGGDLAVITISDQDGPAAVGWVDEQADAKQLGPNRIASQLTDRSILGPMVITGLGSGDDESMSSVHDGLRRVLDQMSHAYPVATREAQLEQRQRTD